MGAVILGKPKKPLPESVNAAVLKAVANVEGIAEVHFPLMFAPDFMKQQEQTLIIIVGRDRNEQSVMQQVMDAIRRELPEGPDFPAIALNGKDPFASSVRGTGCRLYRSTTERPARPWWRLW